MRLNRQNTRKRSIFNKYLFCFLLLFILIAIGVIILNSFNDTDGNISDTNTYSQSEPSNIDNEVLPDIPIQLSEDDVTPVSPNCVIEGAESLYENSYVINNPNDIACIVNKKYNLSSGYEPEDLVAVDIRFAPGRTDDVKQIRTEASAALSELCAAAEQEGYILYGASGYRSYNVQKILFNKSVASKGSIAEANKFNALPGQSEHQLGLAMDFTLEELNYKLNQSFGDTEEGLWLKENCYKYGFIIRYPKDKEEITGYSYEPWHCRYVGKEIAEYIYENNLTLEEYYNLY